jgi:hypothetical protein
MFFSSVAGSVSTGTFRPSSIEITVRDDSMTIVNQVVLSNVLDSLDGDEWDTLTTSVDVPSGATSLSMQAFLLAITRKRSFLSIRPTVCGA